MDMYDEHFCCANAAECQHMAAITRNEQERLAWLETGESWLRLAHANAARPANLKKTRNESAGALQQNEKEKPPLRLFGT